MRVTVNKFFIGWQPHVSPFLTQKIQITDYLVFYITSHFIRTIKKITIKKYSTMLLLLFNCCYQLKTLTIDDTWNKIFATNLSCLMAGFWQYFAELFLLNPEQKKTSLSCSPCKTSHTHLGPPAQLQWHPCNYPVFRSSVC